ncbi:MAG: DUF983 domain-containing protein [Neomegalonema sp.]|nr:DUF983 domain-containing protein [Neomegalonema sp.]
MEPQAQSQTSSPLGAAEPASFGGPRDIWQALMNGLRQRCPNCGEGRLFVQYLSVRESCSECGLRLDGHRADDFPPYLTIIVVAHLLIPAFVLSEKTFHWSTTTHYLVWPPLAIAACLLLLPRFKGAVIGQQWATRAFGFGENTPADDVS